MYQQAYADVLEHDQFEARRVEADALDRVVRQLRRAGTSPATAIAALHDTRQLWMVLLNELAAPENALPDTLRANLISIGLWVLREAEAIRIGQSTNYDSIADVCGMIRDGLKRH